MASESILREAMSEFRAHLSESRFILYGSGDFHHLAGWWLSLALERGDASKGCTLISFDNHPDWDIRPPRWACGGWINRALEMAKVSRAAVWGCGNFELAFPTRLFRNRRALSSGRLKVHAWAERQSPATARRFKCMTREAWRGRFSEFARGLGGGDVYVTIDMDVLAAAYAVTNWENGLMTPEDIGWALGEIRSHARVIGGDCCGAWSAQIYARQFQRFAAKVDHPAMSTPSVEEARGVNHHTLGLIWSMLADGGK